jgi:hypothetical protein
MEYHKSIKKNEKDVFSLKWGKILGVKKKYRTWNKPG